MFRDGRYKRLTSTTIVPSGVIASKGHQLKRSLGPPPSRRADNALHSGKSIPHRQCKTTLPRNAPVPRALQCRNTEKGDHCRPFRAEHAPHCQPNARQHGARPTGVAIKQKMTAQARQSRPPVRRVLYCWLARQVGAFPIPSETRVVLASGDGRRLAERASIDLDRSILRVVM